MRIKIGDTYQYTNFLGKPARVTVTDITLFVTTENDVYSTAAHVSVRYHTGKTMNFGCAAFVKFLTDESAVKVEEAQ